MMLIAQTKTQPSLLRRFFLLLLMTGISTTYGQQLSPVQILTPTQANELFPAALRHQLNITFPILRVYKYADKTGQYYCILTESRNEINPNHDTINLQVKAINVKAVDGTFTEVWQINDKIFKNEQEESSIWFWTRYIEFKDYDKDGIVEPIVIYGTAGSNGYDDGRIKFIIYYKGQKFAIRHQNGVLDDERETQVDQGFYQLPATLQANIQQKMDMMTKERQAIFPANWKAAMKKKKTVFNERP